MKKKCEKKQVCKSNPNTLKILKVLYENKEGVRVKTIQKLADLKQSVVYKRLNILRKKRLVENTYPIWKISNGSFKFVKALLKDSNIFELHKLGFVVKLVNKPKWWKTRKNRLMKVKGFQFKRIAFGKNNSNPYEQLINDNYVIQTYPESIIIICRKRYCSALFSIRKDFSRRAFKTGI